MNKNNLKSYAPQARKDFISAVTASAQRLGITSTFVQEASLRGDVLFVDGVEWPAKVASQRTKLLDRIAEHGFDQTMEEVAYTWFNRFAALRYMELHDFLEHGYRVLSSRDSGLPELLRHAASVSLPGLQAAKVQELQMAGNRDDELYKALLVAQCNELSRVMPFLFERIDDETELLLPENLLRTDSIVAKLVAGVPEEDWQEIEVIGWLYQFYISEKKDRVIGKVVNSQDIPAATQLFTPNWIVQYLVHNSVGRLWLMANPQSTLASEWPYYITPAAQTPEVQAHLDALIQIRVVEDGDSLNPESLKVLDPACGSGHILVVAYDVLMSIYLERGYRRRDIPRLILEKNLYGLDIDDRAAQMAGFALLMKARADDRRLFTTTDDVGVLRPPKLNVLSLQESKCLNVDELVSHLAPFMVQRSTIYMLLETFQHAKTFGSLIQIPYALKTQLAVLPDLLANASQSGDMYASAATDDLLPLVQQARVLAMQFDAVVANPPYMGGKGLNPLLKSHLQASYEDVKSDLFSAFIKRCSEFAGNCGHIGVMCPNVWMYISSHEKLREYLTVNKSLANLVELPLSGFKGATVQICAFTFNSWSFGSVESKFIRLTEFDGGDDEMSRYTREAIARENCGWLYHANVQEFKKIPGNPIAYWASKKFFKTFEENSSLENVGLVRQGASTSDNSRFLRLWHEIAIDKIGFDLGSLDEANKSGYKWFPYNKGGSFRKWFGNHEYVINYENDGKELKEFQSTLSQGWTVRLKSREYYFRPSVSWPKISSGNFSARYYPQGFIFDVAGCCYFPVDEREAKKIISYLNSTVAKKFLEILSPTLNFEIEQVKKLPYVTSLDDAGREVELFYSMATEDWNVEETSWAFSSVPFLTKLQLSTNLETSWGAWCEHANSMLLKMRQLEEDNNRYWIDAFDLQDELSPKVLEDQITLTRPHREKDCQSLISYAIGCMMGRYSLDATGLIFAHAGNVGFNPSRYKKFAADVDGILPLTDEHWFEDDAPSRVADFLQAIWGEDSLSQNMSWLAESLGCKVSETPEETIRRYIAGKFYKDHLQAYKKRPIYWLFSSGKQGAFQALVYMHRYTEGTLSRMRSEYVIPLTAKFATRLEMLEQDANASSSASARTKIAKQIETLRKKQVELLAFDEKLRHYADMRISLDLDDGVKVNYGKFGDLLDSVKVISGGKDDE
jgi:type II restriction/modification system DNA methylase subunit YeeA